MKRLMTSMSSSAKEAISPACFGKKRELFKLRNQKNILILIDFYLIFITSWNTWGNHISITDGFNLGELTYLWVTGKLLSEALIFESTDPQYDDICVLPIELQVQYVLENTKLWCCVQKLVLTFRRIYAHNMFSPSSAKIRASDKLTCTTSKFKRV